MWLLTATAPLPTHLPVHHPAPHCKAKACSVVGPSGYGVLSLSLSLPAVCMSTPLACLHSWDIMHS